MEDKQFGKLPDLKQEIRDDINLAKNPYEILLRAVKEIGEFTGEDNFYSEIRDSIVSVYGYALKEKSVLENELEEVKARREKIQAALADENFNEDVKKRIQYALERHDKEIKLLESLIAEH